MADKEFVQRKQEDVLCLEDRKFYIVHRQKSFGEEALCDSKECFLEWIEKEHARNVLFFCEEHSECKFLFYSRRKDIRALEFMDYLNQEFGLSKGDAVWAFGRIRSAVLKVRLEEAEKEGIKEFLCQQVLSYFRDVDWIDAAVYGKTHEQENRGLPAYQKKKVVWAYVKSLTIAPQGSRIRFRSLENESGTEIAAAENEYIMIGKRGEVYEISRDKFERTYEPSDEPLDIFESMMDNMPEAKLVESGEYVSLDEAAHICYPKPGGQIFVKELTRRTKVFPRNGEGEYFVGDKGDFMAVRADDSTDIYIIRRDIFRQTYERIK